MHICMYTVIEIANTFTGRFSHQNIDYICMYVHVCISCIYIMYTVYTYMCTDISCIHTYCTDMFIIYIMHVRISICAPYCNIIWCVCVPWDVAEALGIHIFSSVSRQIMVYVNITFATPCLISHTMLYRTCWIKTVHVSIIIISFYIMCHWLYLFYLISVIFGNNSLHYPYYIILYTLTSLPTNSPVQELYSICDPVYTFFQTPSDFACSAIPEQSLLFYNCS